MVSGEVRRHMCVVNLPLSAQSLNPPFLMVLYVATTLWVDLLLLIRLLMNYMSTPVEVKLPLLVVTDVRPPTTEAIIPLRLSALPNTLSGEAYLACILVTGPSLIPVLCEPTQPTRTWVRLRLLRNRMKN